jgi:hypothetical protein
MKRILLVVLGLLIVLPLYAADNFEVTAGAGTTLAFDDAAGVYYQKVKLIESTADSTTPTGVAASPLQVSLANTAANAAPVVVDLGTNNDVTAKNVTAADLNCTEASAADIKTSVQLLDNAIDGNYYNVNMNLAGTDAPSGAGTEAGVLRVTLPTDGTGVVKLGAGTAEVGKLAAGTAEIGNVKNAGTFAVQAASTVADGADVTLGAKADAKSTATDTTAVSIMSVLKEISYMEQTPASRAVTFTGSTDAATQTTLAAINTKLTTGTVIGDVNLGATDNAVLDSIVTNTNRAAITGYGQAKLDHADVTTAQVLIAAVADKKFYITSIILSVAAAGSYWIEDDDAAQITSKFTLAANGGVSWSCPIDTPFKSTTVNKGLKLKGSAAGVVGIMITYYTLA